MPKQCLRCNILQARISHLEAERNTLAERVRKLEVTAKANYQMYLQSQEAVKQLLDDAIPFVDANREIALKDALRNVKRLRERAEAAEAERNTLAERVKGLEKTQKTEMDYCSTLQIRIIMVEQERDAAIAQRDEALATQCSAEHPGCEVAALETTLRIDVEKQRDAAVARAEAMAAVVEAAQAYYDSWVKNCGSYGSSGNGQLLDALWMALDALAAKKERAEGE